jgi:hypothetical protein
MYQEKKLMEYWVKSVQKFHFMEKGAWFLALKLANFPAPVISKVNVNAFFNFKKILTVN